MATDLDLAPAIIDEAPAPAGPTADELMAGLSVRRQRFINEFVQCGRAGLAARRAGYSAKSCDVLGHKLMRQPAIRRAIDALMKESGPSPDEIIAELWRIATFDATDFDEVYRKEDGRRVVDMKKVRELGLGRMLKRIGVHGSTAEETVVWHDRVEALHILAKLLGMASDAPHVQVNVANMSVEELKAIAEGR